MPSSISLYKFQKQGIDFGVKKHGRVLLADEMGVGKTIQALCIAWLFKEDWPLCIITPASLKLNWRDEITKFFEGLMDPKSIFLVKEGKKEITKESKVIICSYEIAKNKTKELKDIGTNSVIADEAHYLKSAGTKRSKALIPFMQGCKRVILVTGTPAFARPQELYNLCQIIRPDVFTCFKSFGERYCDPKFNLFSRTTEYSGCKNAKELNFVLKSSFMIRRLKKDVLSELPSKVRQKIPVECDKAILKEIQKTWEQIKSGLSNVDELIEKIGSSEQSHAEALEQQAESKRLLQKIYSLTGKAKIGSVCKFIDDLLENDIKFLVFGHHIEILDKIEETLLKRDKGQSKYVRIDGSTSLNTRHEYVNQFNTDPNCKVALLSLTAASQGITMTSAFTVVFAEIHWTPAIMVQAEDRCHRLTQVNNVTCFYLYGDKTLDEELYKKVVKKYSTVSEILDGRVNHQSYDFQDSNSNSLANSLSIAQRISANSRNTNHTEMDEDLVEEVNENQKNEKDWPSLNSKFDYVEENITGKNGRLFKGKTKKDDPMQKNIMTFCTKRGEENSIEKLPSEEVPIMLLEETKENPINLEGEVEKNGSNGPGKRKFKAQKRRKSEEVKKQDKKKRKKPKSKRTKGELQPSQLEINPKGAPDFPFKLVPPIPIRFDSIPLDPPAPQTKKEFMEELRNCEMRLKDKKTKMMISLEPTEDVDDSQSEGPYSPCGPRVKKNK